MNLKKISKCFFINLNRRKDRLDHINKTLPFYAQRFRAIDANELELTPQIHHLFKNCINKLTKAEIACLLSHYSLWKKLITDKNAENYLILEDDVVFKPGFQNFWNKAFSKNLPNKYNLIYLGGCQPWNKPQYHKVLKPYNQHFCNIKENDFFTKGDHYFHMNAQSYIISKQGASLICQYVDQLGFDLEKPQADIFMINFFNKNKFFEAPDSIFHLYPNMSYQLHEENDNIEIDKKSDLRHAKEKFSSEIIFPNLSKIKHKQIPKKIHLSWKDKNVLDSDHQLIKKGAKNLEILNPDWDIKVYDDEDINRTLRDSIGLQNWNLIKDRKITEKTDLWRLIKTYKEGGLYVDIDRYIDTPLSEIIKEKTSIVLPTFQDVDFSQDFILTCAQNPIIGQAIAKNINYRKKGKGLFFLAVQSYMHAVTEILDGKPIDRGSNEKYFNAFRKKVDTTDFIETYKETGPDSHILFRNLSNSFDELTFKKDKADFYNQENVTHWNDETEALHKSLKEQPKNVIRQPTLGNYKLPQEKESFIPKNIFQTWEISKFEKVFDCLTNKIKNNNPEYNYYFFNAEQRRDFLKKNFYPDVVECYDRIIPNAFKADLWRYCVMYKTGGIYCDINMVSLAPFDSLINNGCTFFAPIDNPRKDKGSLLLNGFFGCTPGCEIIKTCIEIIIDNIKNNFWHNNKTDDIIFDYLNFSGPGVLGRALNKFLERKEYASLETKHGVIHKNHEKINLLQFCKDKETIKDLDGKIILQNKNGSESLKKLINQAASSYGFKHWGEHLGSSRKPYIEDICEINPTAVCIGEKKYTLYRTESYPQNCPSYYESKCGKKINFYRSMSGYRLELECGKKIDCTFAFDDYSYKKSKMIELAGTNKIKIEDIRFIEDSFSEENGQLKSLACCTVIKNFSVFSGEKNEDGSWNEKKKLGLKMNTSPGVCEVNLSSGEIKLVCDLNKEAGNIQKNWMIFKNKGEYYCIYSMFPLIYQKSKDIKKINFTEKQKSTTPEKHNATCPIKIGHNKYAMICHGERKIVGKHWSYDKYVVSFDLINNKIRNIQSEKIKKAKPQHYCSSIIKEGSVINVLAGISDINNDSFTIDPPGVYREKKQKLILTKKNLFELDFLLELFGDPEVIIDEEMNTSESNSVVVYSDMYANDISIYPKELRKKINQLQTKQRIFLEKLKNKNCMLVHLSDEHCHADISYYKNFKHVFRQYYREDAVADNVTFIPLGYKKGFNHE
jgi:mannosyltransferase OCH1-like enzyme